MHPRAHDDQTVELSITRFGRTLGERQGGYRADVLYSLTLKCCPLLSDPQSERETSMLRLGGGADAKSLRNRLGALFRNDAAATTRRRLTTRGGPVDDALIYWVDLGEGQGVWAHFFNPPGPDGNRWLCWFGVNLGRTEGEALVPAVEINLPTTP
jgi:hypothetical protein